MLCWRCRRQRISCLHRRQERIPEAFIDALIDEDGHLGASEQKVFRFFESGDRRFTRDCGKAFQEVFEGFAAFGIVQEQIRGSR